MWRRRRGREREDKSEKGERSGYGELKSERRRVGCAVVDTAQRQK